MPRSIQQMTEEERFRLLAGAVTDCALYMLDPDGVIVSWNSGASRLKRYSASEIVGQHFSRLFNAEDRKLGAPEAALAEARRNGHFESEGWRVRQDGTAFWALAVLETMKDDDGSIIGFANITRDMTERREAQQALERSQEQLAYLNKMDALGRLTGSIAHNFNNLLMIVSGHTQTAKKLLENDPRGARAIAAIETATKRGATLTRHMLSFSGRRQLHPETLDLKTHVEDFGWLLNSIIVNTSLTIVIPQDLWLVETDASELELALVNIVLNSREAMPEGGAIVITAENVHLPDGNAPKHLSGDFVSLTVVDTGVGIPADILTKIFDPFFTTKQASKGAGLGLSQVYGFAAQSRGAVGATSDVGKGTKITLHLPRVDAARVSAPLEDDTNVASVAGARVLIVEDDPGVAEATVSLMDQLGCKYSVADGAEAALLLLDNNEKFDLVFSDVVMPGAMDGLALADTLRRRYQDLPILLASGGAGKTGDGTEEKFLILRKPYEIGDLRRAMADLLNKPGQAAESNLLRFPHTQRARKMSQTDKQ
jgi:PAS domain S-box-containing protein